MIECECGEDLGSIEAIYTTLKQTNGGPAIRVGRGFRVTLAPGFTNAKVRHSSGLPWFVRHARNQLQTSGKVRAPVMVTCRCGRETQLERFSPELGPASG